MKRLILVRHAQAIRLSGQTDFERSLTKKGYEEALKAADYLSSKPFSIDALFSSNADRAVETARIIFDQDENIDEIHVENELYNCSEETLLEFFLNLDPLLSSVMVVGHNPAITSIIQYFKIICEHTKLNRALNYEITAKIIILEFDTDSWNGIINAKCNLLDVFYP